MRTIQLEVPAAELSARANAWRLTEKSHQRGYVHLYQTHVEQAHLGADMDFLKGGSGSKVDRDSH
jgi:dihydroxy-acid dehydratase